MQIGTSVPSRKVRIFLTARKFTTLKNRFSCNFPQSSLIQIDEVCIKKATYHSSSIYMVDLWAMLEQNLLFSLLKCMGTCPKIYMESDLMVNISTLLV